jgi:biotin transporter BioY
MSAFAAFLVGVVPFLPGDALKGAAVFFIARRLEGLGIGPWALNPAGIT